MAGTLHRTKIRQELLEGQVAIDVSETRSQLQNKQRAIELLNELVTAALEPNRPRLPTQPPKSAKVAQVAPGVRSRYFVF